MMTERSVTNRVIFHHSASPDVSAGTIREWHKEKGWEDIGYHFVVREDGSVEVGRDQLYVGAHAKGKNGDSIGVCITGSLHKHKPTPEQLAACEHLYIWLCIFYEKYLKIEFHHANCPGVYLDRKAFAQGCIDKLKTNFGTITEIPKNKIHKNIKKGTKLTIPVAVYAFISGWLKKKGVDGEVVEWLVPTAFSVLTYLIGHVRDWLKHRD